jgi:membrane protease YdiL (CAAX protease family)
MSQSSTRSNRRLLLPYLLPFLLYIGIGAVAGDSLSREISYATRLVATSAALIWAWRLYVPLTGPKSKASSVAVGAAFGLLGTILWVALRRPFVSAGSEVWSEAAFWLRVSAATLVVPLFEELLMRGYVLRFTVQWDRARGSGAAQALGEALDRCSIDEVEPGAWTPLAVLISTGIFTLGHTIAEWPAAIAYGLLMAGLWIIREDLLSCVTAHAVTNLSLALYVRGTGQWALW